ncbi:MAG: ATP-binding protein [Candidatus Hydrothermarchaeota archaeon]|nr:ATP-binding protein [Candidatus Hydrothermarchaeota archaeon]
MAQIVGMIFGEVGYREFNFILSKNSNLQKGGYVKVNHENYGWIIAQVGSIRRYNEQYSLNAITGATQPKGDPGDRVVAKAKVIGYIDDKGFLRNPKMPFRPGEKVYEADSGIIRRSLNLGVRSGIYLGLLDGHKESVPIYLNINKLVQKHVCVLAKTGAGKSYTVGVLIEELTEKGVPVVIIDPHGEYSSLKNPNTNPRELSLMSKYMVSSRGYERIVEYTPNQDLNPQADRKLSLDISKLSIANFLEMLPTKVSDTQKGILFETLKIAKSHGKYAIEDLIRIIQDHENKAKWNLITNLEMLRESKIFEGRPVHPPDLVKKGVVSIINLRGVRPDIQEIIVTRLVSEIFSDRKRGKVPPLFFLLEEAHNFAPERGFGKSTALGIVRTIASEGRKFGMGLCVVSQRPARVDKSVLSQCNTQIILKVTNPNDLRAISQSIEGFTADLEDEIMQLQPGVALIVGDVVEQPIFVDIRVKKSRHGGASVEVVRDARAMRVPTPRGILKKLFFR